MTTLARTAPALLLLLPLVLITGCGRSAFRQGSSSAQTLAADDRHVPTLYLIGGDPNNRRFEVVTPGMVCQEPNLVIVTHGWYESESWPALLAAAIQERVDAREWRCGWFDWRHEARRLLPPDAAKAARDHAGPLLGRQMLQLSRQWRHVHLIGHSAGVWVVNEAAGTIAPQTSASIHLTFLDAYVPQGWDQKALGSLVGDPCETCWLEHYLTRDVLGLVTSNALVHAHNVDITDINPGFNEHVFPRHWYYATVLGRYEARGRLGRADVLWRADGVAYGYQRSFEAGAANWQRSVTLRPARRPEKIVVGR